MDAVERERTRREILVEMATLFIERLAADEWGRVLVTIQRAKSGTGFEVAGMDVEEIVGSDAKVDAAFNHPSVGELLPVIASASEALAAIAAVDLDLVGGGTFVRLREGGFAWLAGLVRTPSMTFDNARDGAVAQMTAKNESLRARFGIGEGSFEVDTEDGVIRFANGATANAALIGSYARPSRTWAWGSSNPSLSAVARKRSAALIDAIPERDAWELSEPHFTTDEPTAFALAAYVAHRGGAEGVFRAPHAEGAIFFTLRDVRAP